MALMIALNQTVMASADHVACDLDEETVILSLKSGEYFGLNPVAAAIWKMIQVRRSVSAVKEALLAQFKDVAPEQCEQELLELLGELETVGLVEVH